MRSKPGLILAFVLIVLLFASILSSRSWPADSRLFVLSCSGPAIIFLVILMAKELSSPTGGKTVEGISRGEAGFFCWIFGFLAGIWLIGFQLSAILFIFLYVRFQGHRSLRLSLLLTFSVFLVVTGIFTKFLHISWPENFIETWL